MPNVSVVILCYKSGVEAETFTSQIIDAVETFTNDWEIVLVGNYNKGDADDTPEIVRRIALQSPRIKALTLEKQGMMGWDARMGLAVASGDVLVLIDGDRQMPAMDVPKVLRLFQEKQCDLAMTYRKERRDGIARVVNSALYNVIFRILFPGCGVRDVNSKPKALSRELYSKLNLTSDDWFLDAEIVIKTRNCKAKIEEVSTIFHRNEDRKSFVRADAIVEFLVNLIKTRIKEFFHR